MHLSHKFAKHGEMWNDGMGKNIIHLNDDVMPTYVSSLFEVCTY